MFLPKSTTNAELVRRIADLFKECEVGKIVTWAKIDAVTRCDTRKTRRFLVYGAIRLANAECGFLSETHQGFGYERLPASEAQAIGRKGLKGIRRASRRVNKTMSNALALSNDMSDDDRRKASLVLNQFNLIEMLASTSHLTKVEVGSPPPPPAAAARATAEAMRNSIGQSKAT